MLHIVTQSQANQDDVTEFNALSNPIYRIIIQPADMRHHDFTMWGKVVADGLRQRGASTGIVKDVFNDVENIILYFLNNNKLNASVINKNLFQYESFNTGK